MYNCANMENLTVRTSWCTEGRTDHDFVQIPIRSGTCGRDVQAVADDGRIRVGGEEYGGLVKGPLSRIKAKRRAAVKEK